MEIAALDLPLASGRHTGIRHLRYLQQGSLARSDIALWDPAASFPAFESRLERAAPQVLGVRGGEELLALARHWRQEFAALLRRGGTIVAMIPPPSAFHVHTLQEIIRYEPLESLLPLLPQPLRYADPASATGPWHMAGEPFRAFFEQHAQALRPQARLTQFPGTAILHDAGGAALACYISMPPAGVLLMPRMHASVLSDPPLCERFLDALLRCVRRLGYMGGTTAIWADAYQTRAEMNLLARARELRRRVDELQAELGSTQAAIGRLESEKQLIAGDDGGLRLALAELLRRQGAFVQQDWLDAGVLIAELRESYLVIAVCGPDEAPEEGYFHRLEQARARIADYFGKSALAMVVDGSQNRLPLADRRTTSEIQAGACKQGILCLQGAHLYGWLMLPEAPGADELAARLRRGDATLPDTLWRSALRALLPAAPEKSTRSGKDNIV